MKNLKIFVSSTVAAGVLALGGLMATAHAAQGSSDRTGTITPWKAMSIAEAKTGGRALQAVYEFDDGQWGYAVIVVAKHKLWEVELNRNTGKIGDVETADPAGEAKEFESDLKRALK